MVMTSPGAGVAFAYSRYIKEFGAPDDALAPLAISNRKFAMNNELAVVRKGLTYDDYMNSRYIAEPLRLFDYCLHQRRRGRDDHDLRRAVQPTCASRRY